MSRGSWKTACGFIIFYIPSGGNIADAVKNEKFDHKLRFVEEMRDWFLTEPVSKSIILGDFNIAPAPADV